MINEPSVSVIMPVHNAAKYLREAIESILNQTLKNFQFIIINDHSTDDCANIISSYNDERIIYHEQQTGKGVVAAMNTGLTLVKAPFIAVMHADDISVKDRLEKQLKILQENIQTAVVAGKTTFINEEGKPTGSGWKVDEEADTIDAIRKKMIWENCISHPTVMMRTSVVKQYHYNSSSYHKGFAVEDYPLWLHLLSDGYHIDKLDDKILFYRIHTKSATNSFLRKGNGYYINYITKKEYLEQRKQLKRFNAFDRKVQLTMYIDFILSKLKMVKSSLKK